jgi:2,4-dienoyl-CoA reductase-like NADH-dependent reductase (Old Yellow Enzyme family)
VTFGRVPAPEKKPGEVDGRGAHMDRLVEMLARGDFDLVAVGRAMLADAAWAKKVCEERFSELNPFTPEVLKTLA